jgi:hypothetical protein
LIRSFARKTNDHFTRNTPHSDCLCRPVRPVPRLRKLILGDVRTWPDKQPVMLVSREPSSDLFKCLLSSIIRMNDAEYHRYILSSEFRGGEPLAVRTVNSGAVAAKIIAALGGSMAVVSANELPALGGTVRVVRVNGKEPGEAGYPL